MIDNKITIKDDEKVNIQRGAIGPFYKIMLYVMRFLILLLRNSSNIL